MKRADWNSCKTTHKKGRQRPFGQSSIPLQGAASTHSDSGSKLKGRKNKIQSKHSI